MLDLSSLKKAVDALARSLVAAHDERLALSAELRETVRAGVIQNFEVAYELCWKFIQRWIRENRSPQEAEPRTRKELFRLAARHGLIPVITPVQLTKIPFRNETRPRPPRANRLY